MSGARSTSNSGSRFTQDTKTVVPLRWTAVGIGATGLFPELEADLEIAPLAQGRSQLAMSARYVPPLGVVGRALDRAVLFRVAEATIKNFLDRVEESTTSPFRACARTVELDRLDEPEALPSGSCRGRS